MIFIVEYAFLIAYNNTRRLTHRIQVSDRAEGVISTAVAVLVVAFLGVFMYTILHEVMGRAQTNADNQVDKIGQDAPN